MSWLGAGPRTSKLRPARFTRSLLEPIIEGPAGCGVWFEVSLGGARQRVHYFWHYVANRMLTLLSDIFTNLKLTDMGGRVTRVVPERGTGGS